MLISVQHFFQWKQFIEIIPKSYSFTKETPQLCLLKDDIYSYSLHFTDFNNVSPYFHQAKEVLKVGLTFVLICINTYLIMMQTNRIWHTTHHVFLSDSFLLLYIYCKPCNFGWNFSPLKSQFTEFYCFIRNPTFIFLFRK